MIFLAGCPPLKRIIVGIESTSYFAEVTGFSSVLSLTTRKPRSWEISSSTGATMRHGPHQGAQKSTSTGSSASMTSAWKLESVTSIAIKPTIQTEVLVSPPQEEDEVRADVDLDERSHHE